jgi:hypothetical protein
MRNEAELVQRRRQLRLRAAQQREELALALAPVVNAARTVDRATATARWIGSQPQILVGAGVAAAVLGVLFFTRRPVRLLAAGATALRAWRWVRILLIPLRFPGVFPPRF